MNSQVKIISLSEEGLVALEKPINILSHPNESLDQLESLLSCNYDLKEKCYKAQNFCFYLLNRLDAATSGVILGCFNPDLVNPIQYLFRKRQVKKTYIALVKGFVSKKTDTWRHSIATQCRAQHLVSKIQSGAHEALTKTKVLKYFSSAHGMLSLLELQPLTGRTHQLRVQCQKMGFPILGDERYGDFQFNRWLRKMKGERLYLHSLSIEFEFDFGEQKKLFRAVSPLPKTFDSKEFGKGSF